MKRHRISERDRRGKPKSADGCSNKPREVKSLLFCAKSLCPKVSDRDIVNGSKIIVTFIDELISVGNMKPWEYYRRRSVNSLMHSNGH